METLQTIFQAEIIQRLGWTLMHFIWQAAAIGLILAVVLRLLRKSSANLRYVIACMALALIVVMPTVTIRMVDVSVVTIAPIEQTAIQLPRAVAETQVVVEMPLPESPATEIAASPRVSIKDRFSSAVEPALPYLVLGWLLGVFSLSLWHLGGWTQLQKLRRQMVKQVAPHLNAKLEQLGNALGIQRAVGLVESALVQVPTVVGHLKPMILLPASALTGLSPEQIEAILAHELAHIKRHDYLVNMLQTVVDILGFYHPAVWWISHRIRVERENCCDDIAVSLCSDSICYAKALTSMEEIRSSRLGLAVALTGGSLLERIRRLLSKENSNESKSSWLPSVIAMLLITAILIPITFAMSSKSEVDDELDTNSNVKNENPLISVCESGINPYTEDMKVLEGQEVQADQLSGIIVDEKGMPIEGVLVDVWTWYLDKETYTDKKGYFYLDKFEPDQKTIEIRFSKEDFTPRYILRQPIGLKDTTVVLDNKTYFEGVVTDPKGQPVSNALIRAAAGTKNAEGVLIGEVWTETRSGKEGKYRLYAQTDA